MGGDYRIRPARRDDLRAVAAIERGTFSGPWEWSAFAFYLGPLFSVCEIEESIAGYVVGRQTADEGEILNVAVAPQWRRRGIGRALLLTVIGQMADNRAVVVYLDVRRGNVAAIRLYTELGFKQVGTRTGYYSDPIEDGLVFELRIDGVTRLTKIGSKSRIFD